LVRVPLKNNFLKRRLFLGREGHFYTFWVPLKPLLKSLIFHVIGLRVVLSQEPFFKRKPIKKTQKFFELFSTGPFCSQILNSRLGPGLFLIIPCWWNYSPNQEEKGGTQVFLTSP